MPCLSLSSYPSCSMFYFSSTLSSTSCLSSGEREESTLGEYDEVSAWKPYNSVEIDYFVDILLQPMEKVLCSMNESNLSKNEGFEKSYRKVPLWGIRILSKCRSN